MSLPSLIQRRISGYLSRQTVSRPILRQVINRVTADLPDTVIFGGMVREFALGNARSFVSDIDLVSMSSQDEIADVVDRYGAVRNKFGGFRFVIEKQRFDVWSFLDTWAFKSGHATGRSFADLLRTSFFNVDSACYHVTSHKLHLGFGYEDCISNRVLDINLEPNPMPEKMARRTLLLLQTQGFRATRRLANYVVKTLANKTLNWNEQFVVGQLTSFLDSPDLATFFFTPQVDIDR